MRRRGQRLRMAARPRCPPRQCCRDSLAALIFRKFLSLGARDGCSRTDGQSSLGVDHAFRRSKGTKPEPRHQLDGRAAVLGTPQLVFTSNMAWL